MNVSQHVVDFFRSGTGFTLLIPLHSYFQVFLTRTIFKSRGEPKEDINDTTLHQILNIIS